ncbi:hypothetical protein [Sphingomonas sp.]|uniref:hypothetical protein n=1 Tax=Sphingomonas sp. TaxID=28214 RepID=UPI003B3A40CB
MAKDVGKPGLTTFGWLALLGAGAAYFSKKERRDKALGSVKGLTDKFSRQSASPAGTPSSASTI